MNLFDTHVHLTDPRFQEDFPEVITRMREVGVSLALTVGDGADDPEGAFALARAYDFIYAAAGIHPHDASAFSPERFEMIRGWMDREKVVALGEIGMDYHYDLSPREKQREAFDAQLSLAYELKKPVIMHIREAHGEAVEMLTARTRAGQMPPGVMHCYTGSWESARQYMDMGLYISLSGAVTFKNAPKLWEVAEKVPLDRLMIETDCPYMAPVPMRGRRNEPSFVRYVAERIAEIRGMDAEVFADAAAGNGKRLFGIH